MGGGISSDRAGLDLGDGPLPFRPKLHSSWLWRRPLSVGSRLLSPLEAINGLLFFGLSTAVLFAIMSELIAHRLRTETGYQAEAAGKLTHSFGGRRPVFGPFRHPR